MTRIGIFGGSFDPIHMGHLVLAEQCRDQLGLDEVRFVPAFISPLKQQARPAPPKDRVEMVKLATGGNPAFVCDTIELDRQGVSYTIDTVRAFQAGDPDAKFFLLMGADSVADLPKWKEPSELLALVAIGAIGRGGVGEPPWESIQSLVSPERWRELQHCVAAPALEISSTDLRQRIASGRSIRYLVPPAVEMYIQQQRLYEG